MDCETNVARAHKCISHKFVGRRKIFLNSSPEVEVIKMKQISGH